MLWQVLSAAAISGGPVKYGLLSQKTAMHAGGHLYFAVNDNAWEAWKPQQPV